MAFKPKKSFEELIPNAPADGIDLLKRLLQFNPDKRLTAEEALKHPYVARFHNPDDEPSLDCDIVPSLDDDVQLSVDEYRVKLYEVGATNLQSLTGFIWVSTSNSWTGKMDPWIANIPHQYKNSQATAVRWQCW